MAIVEPCIDAGAKYFFFQLVRVGKCVRRIRDCTADDQSYFARAEETFQSTRDRASNASVCGWKFRVIRRVPSGVHVGSVTVKGFCASAAFRMAVTGRQKLKWYLAFIQPMNESAKPVHNMANSRAVSEVSSARATASARKARAYCLLVCSVQNS